jgi:hypothetical protein
MENLLWKTKERTINLVPKPFRSEGKFEEFIFETPEIMGDIFLITRQVRCGNNSGIPDIIGIDTEGNICIVELKNRIVDAHIIPQVLRYAFWAETNPDSIKSLWLECENKPGKVKICWNNPRVRIIVIAPEISRSTMDIVNKINYPVDLIEVKRWVDEENNVLLVNKLKMNKLGKIVTTKGGPPYDEEFYKTQYQSDKAMHFMNYVREIESIIRDRGWSLYTKYNKNSCSFKSGFFNAFGIEWSGSKDFSFFFKLAKNQIRRLSLKGVNYNKQWKTANVSIKPGRTRTMDFFPLFEMAYRKISRA